MKKLPYWEQVVENCLIFSLARKGHQVFYGVEMKLK